MPRPANLVGVHLLGKVAMPSRFTLIYLHSLNDFRGMANPLSFNLWLQCGNFMNLLSIISAIDYVVLYRSTMYRAIVVVLSNLSIPLCSRAQCLHEKCITKWGQMIVVL